MCFNAETSMAAFLFGVLCGIFVLKRGLKNKNLDDILTGILIFLIVNMQLIEYFLWKNQLCNKTNKFFSILIIFVLYLQPVVFYLILNRYLGKNLENRNIINFLVLLFTILTGIIIYYLYNKKICSLKDKNGCRLVWDSLNYLMENKIILGILFFFFYFLFAYIIREILIKQNIIDNTKFFRNNLLTVSLFLTLIITIINKGNKFYETFGSLWCIIAVLLGLFAALNI
jgi:hypothetical protein